MVDGLLLVPLHLLQQLLLPPRLLPLLSLSLLLLLGELLQALLMLPVRFGLGALRCHLVQEALFLSQTLALGFLSLVALWGDMAVSGELRSFNTKQWRTQEEPFYPTKVRFQKVPWWKVIRAVFGREEHSRNSSFSFKFVV